MRAMADLLASRPEQEGALLTSLVNKLGDPSRKLASKVSAALRLCCSYLGISDAWCKLAALDMQYGLALHVDTSLQWNRAREMSDNLAAW